MTAASNITTEISSDRERPDFPEIAAMMRDHVYAQGRSINEQGFRADLRARGWICGLRGRYWLMHVSDAAAAER